MRADITILLTLLMKNEDVWLKIPSEQLFDDVILALKMAGVEYATRGGNQIQIISLESKKKRENQEQITLEQLQQHLLTQRRMLLQRTPPPLPLVVIMAESESKEKENLIEKMIDKVKSWTG